MALLMDRIRELARTAVASMTGLTVPAAAATVAAPDAPPEAAVVPDWASN